MIASRHDPRTTEEKRLPFADAAPGAADASLLLPLSLGLVHDGLIDMGQLFRLLSAAPAARFGLDGGRLAPGAAADLVLLAPDAPWRIVAERLPGLGRNTPFDGLPVSGQVRGLMKGGQWVARP
jgi:dihydroorotase